MINYKLVRSKRKTIAIYITEKGVEVRAPLKYPLTGINHFVTSKEDWIQKNTAIIEQNLKNKSEFSINYGDNALMRGKEYPVIARQGECSGFDGSCFYLPPDLPPEEIKQEIIKIYKLTAKDFLTERVYIYAKLIGVMPSSVKITNAKTRWGSCSCKNSISFSWHLIMAEDYVMDYVVLHELAHICEHNHSERFWTILSTIMPDYKTREIKLKNLHKKLTNEDW